MTSCENRLPIGKSPKSPTKAQNYVGVVQRPTDPLLPVESHTTPSSIGPGIHSTSKFDRGSSRGRLTTRNHRNPNTHITQAPCTIWAWVSVGSSAARLAAAFSTSAAFRNQLIWRVFASGLGTRCGARLPPWKLFSLQARALSGRSCLQNAQCSGPVL